MCACRRTCTCILAWIRQLYSRLPCTACSLTAGSCQQHQSRAQHLPLNRRHCQPEHLAQHKTAAATAAAHKRGEDDDQLCRIWRKVTSSQHVANKNLRPADLSSLLQLTSSCLSSRSVCTANQSRTCAAALSGQPYMAQLHKAQQPQRMFEAISSVGSEHACRLLQSSLRQCRAGQEAMVMHDLFFSSMFMHHLLILSMFM